MLFSYYGLNKKSYPCDENGYFTPAFRKQWMNAIRTNIPSSFFSNNLYVGDKSLFFKAWQKHWTTWDNGEKIDHIKFLVYSFLLPVNTNHLKSYVKSSSSDVSPMMLYMSFLKPYFDLMSLDDLFLFTNTVMSKSALKVSGNVGDIVFYWYVCVLNYLYERSPDVAEHATKLIYNNEDLSNRLMHEKIEFREDINEAVCNLMTHIESHGPHSKAMLNLWLRNSTLYNSDLLISYFSTTAVVDTNLIDSNCSFLMVGVIKDIVSRYNSFNSLLRERMVCFIHQWFDTLSIDRRLLLPDFTNGIYEALCILPTCTSKEEDILKLVMEHGDIEFYQLLDLYLIGINGASDTNIEILNRHLSVAFNKSGILKKLAGAITNDDDLSQSLVTIVRSASRLHSSFKPFCEQVMTALLRKDVLLLLTYPDLHPIIAKEMPADFKRWVYNQLALVAESVSSNPSSSNTSLDYIIVNILKSSTCSDVLLGADDLHERFLVVVMQYYLSSKTSSFDPYHNLLNTLLSTLEVLSPQSDNFLSWSHRYESCLVLNPDMDYKSVALETLAPGFGANGLGALKMITDNGKDQQWENIKTYRGNEFVHFLHECSMRALHPGYCNDKLDKIDLPHL